VVATVLVCAETAHLATTAFAIWTASERTIPMATMHSSPVIGADVPASRHRDLSWGDLRDKRAARQGWCCPCANAGARDRLSVYPIGEAAYGDAAIARALLCPSPTGNRRATAAVRRTSTQFSRPTTRSYAPH